MRGELGADVSLSEVLRELAAGAATGVIRVEGAAGPARVSLGEGAVCSAVSPATRARLGARLVGAGLLADEQLEAVLADRSTRDADLAAVLVERGLVSRDSVQTFVTGQLADALLEVSGWRGARIEFVAGDVPRAALPVAVEEVIAETERRASAWHEVAATVPSFDHVPEMVDAAADGAPEASGPDEATVLSHVDGQRSVSDLALDLGYSAFDVARLLHRLALAGSVRVRPPGHAATDEVDIGRALEEALFGSAPEQPIAPGDPAPRVARPETMVEPAEQTMVEPAEHRAAAAGAGGRFLAPDDDLEPEVWSATIEVDDEETSPPETVGRELPDPGRPTPATRQPAPAVDRPGPDRAPADPEPAPARPERSDPDEIRGLLAEMNALASGFDEPPHEPGREAPPEPEHVGRVEAPAAAEATPASAPTHDEPVDRGEVSELLRELSRLAEDDERPPANPAAPEPRPSPPSGSPAREDPSKRRRLFGSR